MSGSMEQIWGDFLNSYPHLGSWILSAGKSSVIAVCALGIVLLLGRRSAVARSWAIRVGFVALILAAVWQVLPNEQRRFGTSVKLELKTEARSELLPADSSQSQVSLSKNEETLIPSEAAPPELVEGLEKETVIPSSPIEDSRFDFRKWMEEHLGSIWVGGTLLFGFWFFVRQFSGLLWLRRNGLPASEDFVRFGPEVSERLGVRRMPVFRVVTGLKSPLMTGWLRPWIWLPEETFHLEKEHQRAIIEHEIAHYHRNDLPWQTVASLASALWWWNPIVWRLLKRLRSEAELAADEFVVSGNSTAADYAEALVKVAAGMSAGNSVRVGVPMLGKSSIERRVRAVLSDNPFRNRLGWIASMAITVFALAGALVASFSAVAEETASPEIAVAKTEPGNELAQRAIGILEARHKRMRFLHYKMERTWTMADGQPDSPVTSPVPEKVEIWTDDELGKYRVEFRPRVLRWIDGAAPFSISEQTQVNDGEYNISWRERPRGETPKKNSDEQRTIGGEHDRIGLMHEKKATRMLRFGVTDRSGIRRRISETGANELEIIEEFLSENGQIFQRETIRLDLTSNGMVTLERFEFPQSKYVSEWVCTKVGRTADGVYFPESFRTTNLSKGSKQESNFNIKSFEVLDKLPDGITNIPGREGVAEPIAPDYLAHTGEITIGLLDSKTGASITNAKATYRIASEKEIQAQVSDDGHLIVNFPKKEFKEFTIKCTADGYVRKILRGRTGGNLLKIPESYELKLEPGTEVSGRVLTATGAPVSGASVRGVMFEGEADLSGLADFSSWGGETAKTDENGRWTMQGLPEDLTELHVRVTHPKFVDSSDGSVMGYVMLSGQPLESLRDGSSVITLKEGHRLEGRVLDASGHPVAKCRVTIGDDNFQNGCPVAVTNEAGIYRFEGLKSEKTSMTFEGPRQKPRIIGITLPLAGGKLDDVSLESPKVLRGRILKKDGSPSIGLRVHAQKWQGQRTLKFWTVTDSAGRFQWNAAPEESVEFALGWGQGREHLFEVPLTAQDKELEIVMKPALQVNISVIDKISRKTIKVVRLTTGYGNPGSIYWQTKEAKTVTDGSYVWQTNRFDSNEEFRRTRFLVEAEGYEPFETEAFPTRQQTLELTVELTPTK